MLSQFPYPETPWGKLIEARLLDPDGPSTIGYSLPRSNGKTIEAAKIALYYVAGPGHVPGFDVVVAAPTLRQAAIPWRDVVDAYKKIVPNWKAQGVKIRDYPQLKIVEFPWGSNLTAVAGIGGALHGLRFKCAIIDEPANFPNTRGQRVFNALKTGLGKTPDSKLIVCGTRPADDPGHWFEELLSDSGLSWYADKNADPLDPATWDKANPSLHLPGFEGLLPAIKEEAEKAKKSAGAMASFRCLRLNQGNSEILEDLLCTSDEWIRFGETDDLPPRAGPLVVGIDLGGGRSMSAAAAYWRDTGRLETVGYYGDIPDLLRREERDGQITVYSAMKRRGELLLNRGRTTPPAVLLADVVERYGHPETVIADRFKKPEMEDAAAALGLQVTYRGLGFRDSAPDIREFQAALLEHQIRSAPSLLMRTALAGTLLVRDPAANPKIIKRVREGSSRNDAAVAAVLAIGEGSRRRRQTPPKLYYTPPQSDFVS